MLDEKTLRRKVFLRLLGHPFSVVPFVLGMTAMTASWALNWNPGIGLFAGLAGALACGGAFFTRLLLSGDIVTQQVISEVEKSELDARQHALDSLDQRLAASDKDPRPETALRDLRELVRAFEEGARQPNRFNAGTVIDIHARVNQLFDHCVESLEQTERLWQTSQKLHTPAARKPILDQRETIIDDVQISIKQLSNTLVALQTLSAHNGSNADLARLRDELDQSLAVAKTVEERVNALVNDASTSTLDEPSRQKPMS